VNLVKLSFDPLTIYEDSQEPIMVKKVTLMSLAIPIFFEVILFMTLGVVDTLMLSRISDQAAGAVGIANQLINFTNIIFTI
jgi:Na+-driven multidrug efflux pump